jgi:hypothetical protein
MASTQKSVTAGRVGHMMMLGESETFHKEAADDRCICPSKV